MLLRLLSSHGELVEGRCKATNQCEYCARLAAIENTELLHLDALHGIAPTIVAVLGTADVEPDPSRFYASRKQVMKALKRRWPDVQYAALVEFTTGYGPRSGGKRRPHWNLLLKGIPADAVDQAREVILSVWCARERAAPKAQYVDTIANSGGLIRYVAQHFQKTSQAPPPGWKGHRFLKSRGYLWLPTPAARESARRALAERREIRKAALRGLEAHDAELAAAEALQRASRTTWRLHRMPGYAVDAPQHLGKVHVPDRRQREVMIFEAEAARARAAWERATRHRSAPAAAPRSGGSAPPAPPSLERGDGPPVDTSGAALVAVRVGEDRQREVVSS